MGFDLLFEARTWNDDIYQMIMTLCREANILAGRNTVHVVFKSLSRSLRLEFQRITTQQTQLHLRLS